MKTLDLEATEITDAGLVYLEGMKNLEEVNLGATRVTRQAVTQLQTARPDLRSTSKSTRWLSKRQAQSGYKPMNRAHEHSPDRNSPAADATRADRGFSIRPARPERCRAAGEPRASSWPSMKSWSNTPGPRPTTFASICLVLIPRPRRRWPKWGANRWASRFGSARFRRSAAGPGLYLEDIFVKPGFRGRGIGKGLLAAVAKRAVERGCGRLEWSVLDWNAPAIGFYRALGARPMDEWTVYRIDDEPLRRLAEIAPEC